MTDFLNKDLNKERKKTKGIQAEKEVTKKKSGLKETGIYNIDSNASDDGFLIIDHEEDSQKIIENFEVYNKELAKDEAQDIRDLLALGLNEKRTHYNPKSKGNAERTDTLKDQDEKIRKYIKDIEDGILDVENREAFLAQLELLLNRNETEILINAQKTGGDSKLMKKVKESVDKVEELLNLKYENGMTKKAMDELNSQYGSAIALCDTYLATKGSKIGAWKGRKTLVREMKKRLETEAALVRLGTILYEQDGSSDTIKSGVELITSSRMYQLGSAMQTHIRNAEPEDIKDAVPVEQAIVSVLSEQKDKKSAPGDTVPCVLDVRKFLYQTKPGEAKVGTISIGGQTGFIVHQENGLVRIIVGKKTTELGNAEKIKDDIEADIYTNRNKEYSDEAIIQLLGGYAVNMKEVSPAVLTRGRRLCTEILAERTGIAKPDFDNVPFADLRNLTVGYLAENYSKEDIKEEVEQANVLKKEAVNTEAEMELKRTQTVDVSDVKYSITYEEKEEEWTPAEKQLKDMLAELIYFEDTREQDAFYANKKNFDKNGNITKKAAGKRMRDVLLKNVEALSVILSDNYSKGIKNEMQKNALTSKIRKANPSLSEEEIIKKVNAEFVPEPTLLDNMLDKFPMFMMGDGASMEAKKNVNDAVSGVIKDIIDGIEKSDMNFFEKILAKGALNSPILLEGKVREQLEDAKEGTEIFETMAEGYTSLQDKVTEMENEISSIMDKCTEIFFGEDAAEKKDEKKAENKAENKEEEKKEEAKELTEGKIKEEQKEEKKEEAKELTEEEKEQKAKKESEARIKVIRDRMKGRIDKYNKSKKLVEEYENGELEGKVTLELKKEIEEAQDYVWNFKKNQSNELKQSMEDVAKGNKGQGAYFKYVLQSYFGSLSAIDKRSMIASAIRNAKPLKKSYTADEFNKLSDNDKMDVYGSYMGGMFKGAGPLFQKLLQGLPVGAIPAGLRKSVDDMKDSLAPIPENIVKERMNSIIKNSNGKVTGIEVLKSLGAASVGQAFLCKMTGKDYPDGKEVVIKLLRPDVRNRMAREKKIMEEAAKKVDRESAGKPETDTEYTGGMYATFQGTYKRIAEELDLTLEAKNAVAGKCYNNSSNHSEYVKKKVRVMELDKDVDAGTDTLVLEKAQGVTAKKYMNDAREKLTEMLDPYYEKVEEKGGKFSYVPETRDDKLKYRFKTTYDFNNIDKLEEDKAKLEELIAKTEARQKYLLEIADTWSREAIFKGGFYHGDLHAGNIMLDDNGATIIDFGNATQLTKEQLTHVTRMMIAAGRSDVEPFLEGYHQLLEKTSPKDWNRLKDELKLVFTEVLGLGEEKDAALRISVALMRAQELGFELPAAIANFASCQLRLQNAVDDMNRLLVEMKASRAKLDELDGDNAESFEEMSVYSYYAHQKKSTKDNAALSKKLRKRMADFGIPDNSEEGKKEFLEGLRDSKKRIDFLRNYAVSYSLRAEITALDILLRKKQSELTDEEAADIGRKRLLKKYANKSLIEKGKAVAGKDETASSHYLDFLVELEEIETGYLRNPKAYEPQGLMQLLEKHKLMDFIPKETEFDRAIAKFFEAQDRKASKKELKALEDAVWKARSKMVPEAKAQKNHDEQFKGILKSYSFAFEQRYPNDDAKTKKKVRKANETNIGTATDLLKPFFKETTYGKELEKAFNDFKALIDECAEVLEPDEKLDDGKLKAEVLRAKIEQAGNKLLDISFKAQKNVLKTLIDKNNGELDKKKYKFEDKDLPDDFFDVMGDVIKRNKVSAVRRVGALKSTVILSEMMGEAVVDKFKQIFSRE